MNSPGWRNQPHITPEQQLINIISQVQHLRDDYEPTKAVNIIHPNLTLLLSLIPTPAAVSCIELLLWALDQVANYKVLKECAQSVLKKGQRVVPLLLWNRCAFIVAPRLCDNSEVGRSAKWLAQALEAVNHSLLIHDVYRLNHTIIFNRIMNVIKHFPLGDALTLQRLIMKLTNEEMRELAKVQALYNIGARSRSVPCLRSSQIRSRPKIVFTGEDFNNRPTGLLIRRFIDHPPKDMDLHIIQIGAKTSQNDNYSFRGTGITYFEVSQTENALYIFDKIKFDIIVDTKGLMFKNHCSLLSPRRAPVQIHWLAYPGTMGLEDLDYTIGDDIVCPKNAGDELIEKVIRMPDCYQINDDAYKITAPDTPMRMFRRPGRKLIACVNMNYKICPETIRAWHEIMRRCPEVDINMVCRSQEAINNLKNAFMAGGIANDRVNAHLGQQRDAFIFNIKQEVDLAIDPFRCPGHTTASDCYTAGVPVVSLFSNTYYGRVAHSLAKQMGTDKELTAYTPDDYINKVVSLLRDDQKLQSLKQRIQFQRRWSKLYDPARYMEFFWNSFRIALSRKKRGAEVQDINIHSKPVFNNKVGIITNSFRLQDKSNKAVTRLLFDNSQVLVSPWHNEVWVNGKLITNSLDLPDKPKQPSKSIREYNGILRFHKTKRGTVALGGTNNNIMLGIPFPKTVSLETHTVLVK